MEEMEKSRLMAIEKLYSQVENDFDSVAKDARGRRSWGGIGVVVVNLDNDTNFRDGTCVVKAKSHIYISWLMYKLRDEINAHSGVTPEDVEHAGALANEYLSSNPETGLAEDIKTYAKGLLLYVLGALKR